MLPAFSGASNIYGSGMLSLGMSFSLEQLYIDNETIGMIKYASSGIDVSDETLAYDTIVDVGIGNDFLSSPDTLAHIDNPSQAVVFDRRMRPEWDRDCCPDTADLAHDRVVEILNNHEVEPMSEYALKRFDEIIENAEKKLRGGNEMNQSDLERRACEAVMKYDVKGAKIIANEAVESGADLVSVITNGFTKGIQDVGELFEAKKLFLPHMMAAANAMTAAMDVLTPELEKSGANIESIGTVVICTIEGDIHSIGKDIVAIMLKVAGFNVINLGRDVAPWRSS